MQFNLMPKSKTSLKSLLAALKQRTHKCTHSKTPDWWSSVGYNWASEWNTKASPMLDAWQAFISYLLHCPTESYKCFHQFFLLSEGRCTLPQSCMLTRVSERIGVYDKAQIPSLFPWAHSHPTPATKHAGLPQSWYEKTERARQEFCGVHGITATFHLIIVALIKNCVTSFWEKLSCQCKKWTSPSYKNTVPSIIDHAWIYSQSVRG